MGDYQNKISGPLIDRMDLRVEVPAVTAADLIRPAAAETSAAIAARVATARSTQARRYAGLDGAIRLNAHAPPVLLEEIAAPDKAGLMLLHEAAEKMKLSARAYHRVLKVARTIADLDGSAMVGRFHLAEALTYRGMEDTARLAA